jgi:hypothetical protein
LAALRLSLCNRQQPLAPNRGAATSSPDNHGKRIPYEHQSLQLFISRDCFRTVKRACPRPEPHSANGDVVGDSLRSNYLGMGWTGNIGGLQLRNAVSNEWHTLETTRGIGYGETNRLARSQRQVTRHLLSSTLSRDWGSGNLQLRPRVATSAYRHGEGAFKETSAGAFNLSVGSVAAFGMNLETGLGWHWSLNPRWSFSGDAAITRPLAHSGNHRSARLEGADQVEFQLPALRPDGLDHSFHLGVDYQQHAMRMNFGMRSQRTFGERADQIDLSLAFSF